MAPECAREMYGVHAGFRGERGHGNSPAGVVAKPLDDSGEPGRFGAVPVRSGADGTE